MKTKILFYCFLIIPTMMLQAQYSIGISHIFSDISTYNLNIFGKYNLKDKHQFCLGVKYHFNNDSTIPLFRYYYRNLYSEKLGNKLGLNFEYRYQFLQNKIINPYIFYNFQYSRIGSKFKEFFFTDIPANMMVRQTTLDAINLYENHIGLGSDLKLNKRLHFSAGISAGVTLFTDMRDINDLNNGTATRGFIDSRKQEFSWLFNTGLCYQIGKIKEKKRVENKKTIEN